MGESTAPRKSPPLEGQKTTAIEHSGPTLNTSARHFALERAPARRGPNIKKGPGAQGLKLNHARGDAGAVEDGLLLEGVVVDDLALGAELVADGAHDDEGHAVEIGDLCCAMVQPSISQHRSPKVARMRSFCSVGETARWARSSQKGSSDAARPR